MRIITLVDGLEAPFGHSYEINRAQQAELSERNIRGAYGLVCFRNRPSVSSPALMYLPKAREMSSAT